MRILDPAHQNFTGQSTPAIRQWGSAFYSALHSRRNPLKALAFRLLSDSDYNCITGVSL